MPEGKALVLFCTKNGNTEKVAQRIHDTLRKAGMEVSIARINKDLEVEYLNYNLSFLGAPEVPGVAAVPFCTFRGVRTDYNEAVPMLKHIGQYHEHEGIRVVDDVAVVGVFPEADESYNTEWIFGDIRRRPDEYELLEVEGKVRDILRRLHRVLPLGNLDLGH